MGCKQAPKHSAVAGPSSSDAPNQTFRKRTSVAAVSVGTDFPPTKRMAFEKQERIRVSLVHQFHIRHVDYLYTNTFIHVRFFNIKSLQHPVCLLKSLSLPVLIMMLEPKST